MAKAILEKVSHIYVGEGCCHTASGGYSVEEGLYSADWDGETLSFQGGVGDYFGNTEVVILTARQVKELLEEGNITLFKERPAGGAATYLEEIEG